VSYVIAAYAVTGVTLVLYALHLLRERAKERRSLGRTRSAGRSAQ
jgi:hypothetical protein